MKIFFCWSGPRSHAVAEALNEWIKRVIQAVKPFFSSEIEKGAKWSNELDEALEGTRFGIVCLTPDNVKSEWIHYEAGALSKSKDALVWTFLHGLTPGDVPPPLGKFQHTVAEKDDILRLLKTINARLAEVGGEPLQDHLLEENFELFWPRLEISLSNAERLVKSVTTLTSTVEGDQTRDDRAVLDEILEIVRSQERRQIGGDERFLQPRRRTRVYNKVDLTVAEDKVTNSGFAVNEIAGVLKDLFPTATSLVTDDTPAGLRFILRFATPIAPSVIKEMLTTAGEITSIEMDEWTATLD